METNKTKEFIIRRDCFGNIYTQTELVRCKDCKHYSGQFCNKNDVYPWPKDNWFCADGEVKNDG